jgi:hypothetical protein
MAWTQAHLDAIKEAYASGVLTVTFEGRSTTYRSLDEMERVIAAIEKELNPAKRRRQYRLSSSKGF